MNHKHFRQILISNNIFPLNLSETKLTLKLVTQKEKFILEDSVKAIIYNKKIIPINGKYTLKQYMREIQKITNQYYLLYIQISQFEAFLRTYINHKMVKSYGDKWHKNIIMKDLKDFQQTSIQNLDKPSQALNSISFGTLEWVFLNGSRYANIFQKDIKFNKILAKDGKPKYRNKDMIEDLFLIVRNARNDICHHRRIGESIKSKPKYTKQKMTKSEVLNALEDLKILLGYNNIFDVKSIELKYNDFLRIYKRKLVKLIYIDDSGNTGKKLDDEKQPLFLLGGFIIDENIWKKVDKALNDLKSKYSIENMEIHSIEIMNGKKGTPYKAWDYDKKLKFFEEVLGIIVEFDLQVIYFSVKKTNFKKYFQAKYGKEFEQQFNISPYLLAFSYILQISDSYLISQDSNGMLILDEQDEWKKPANKTFNILTTLADEPEVHIEKLLDRSFFVDSSESNMIQLADIISYTTKRYLEIEIRNFDDEKKSERKKLFEIYEKNIYKPSFDYGSHSILKWLEDNIGNQTKDKPIG